MILLIDTREQAPLTFPVVKGVEVRVQMLPTGDYGAEHDGIDDSTIFERKSLSDCFKSFTGDGYEREKAKWQRAQALGLTYILAIEGTASEVLQGHTYWLKGELHESKKSGLTMVRQLLSIQRRYGIPVWFTSSRKEMAMLIQEFYLSFERIKEDVPHQ